MDAKKIISSASKTTKAIFAALLLPVFVIYIMIDKPDYKVMNAMSHVVIPAARAAGDLVSWPLRALGSLGGGIRRISLMRAENEELRARLNELLSAKHECETLMAENQRLSKNLDIVRAAPKKSMLARVVHDNSALHHSTFLINKGLANGVAAGMTVMSPDGFFVGQIYDAAENFSNVRGIADSASNIPVRIAGSEVYGFLRGNGGASPSLDFLSDPEFVPTGGLKLITSGIRGMFPDGIPVGTLKDKSNADVYPASKLSEVLVLEFDGKERYK
jgi:rod shape-determining protein MreC